MPRIGSALLVLFLAANPADAGLFHQKPAREEVPGGHPQPLVAPNGVEVPAWASRRIQQSPVPLFGPSWGRRPWAFPLAQQQTPSARMARADQLGYGAGPIPGYTNGPPLGNYPQASVGPGDGSFPTRRINKSFFPFVTYMTGN